MKNIKFYFKKHWEILLLVAFWAAFILVYSFRILQFPIFEDEAELLFVSEKVMANPIRNLFELMRYGPLPALSWLVATASAFTKDTLLGGRLLNVFLASSLIIWAYLIKKFYNLPTRFFVFSSLLLMFSPILLLNSRVAIWGTPVMVFSTWCAYFFLMVLKRPNPINSFFFALLLIFSFLIKFTSFFILPGLLVLLAIKFLNKANRKNIYLILKTVLISILVFGMFIYSFRTSVIGDVGSSLITNVSPAGILAKIRHNIWLYINWFGIYYPLFPIYAVSSVYAFSKYRKEKSFDLIMVLSIWFVVASAMMILFNRFFYPRHVLIMLLPMMIITAYSLRRVPLVLSASLVTIIVILRLFLFKDILVDYFRADIAKEDRFQYFEDYTSGVNVDDISQYLMDLSNGKPIVVWLDGSWVMEYGLRRGLRSEDNVVFKSFVDFQEGSPGPPKKIAADPQGVNYVIVNKREPPNIKSFTLVKEFSWDGHKRQYLYRI